MKARILKGIVIAVSSLFLGAVGVRTTHAQNSGGGGAPSEGKSNTPVQQPQAPNNNSSSGGLGACCGNGQNSQ